KHTGAKNKSERHDALMQEGAVTGCCNSQNCVQVCPKGIPLTTSIASMNRQTTLQAFKNFLEATKPTNQNILSTNPCLIGGEGLFKRSIVRIFSVYSVLVSIREEVRDERNILYKKYRQMACRIFIFNANSDSLF